MNTAGKNSISLAEQDNIRIKMGYVKLHEALNELERVYAKDNIIAHAVRQLGAIEDTLFEYVVPGKKGV